MKYRFVHHLARYGYNVRSDGSYQEQRDDRLNRAGRGLPERGSQLEGGGVMGTAAYMERVHGWSARTTERYGDRVAEERMHASIKADAKVGAGALVRRGLIAAGAVVAYLAFRDLNGEFGNAAQNGLVMLGLGKLALGPQPEGANPVAIGEPVAVTPPPTELL